METTKPKKIIKKTSEKLTFHEFCAELKGYQFYKDSSFQKQIYKFELFFYYNLKQASDAFTRFFSVKI